MRLLIHKNSPAYFGAERVKIGKFLLLPKVINGEFRWLEKANWVQSGKFGFGIMDLIWVDSNWLSDKEVEKHLNF